jgi:ribosomal protein S18 acetylase RimI-like enzyme
MHKDIRLLEHVTMRAWPALEILHYDGWTLRAANGYSGRANSVNPLDDSSLSLEDKLEFCESWYAQRQLPCLFRLNEAMQPPHLDEVLERWGYERSVDSLVKTVNLPGHEHSIDARFSYGNAVQDDWLGDWGRWNNVPDLHIRTAKTMLSNSPAEACYGRIEDKAVGLAVREGDYVGLFDIVVSPEHRRQGLGEALVSSLLAWGREQGAKTGYLQVLSTNQAALELYRSLGFIEHHRYWYRKK